MNVQLGAVFDDFVADLLKTGPYQTQSEVLRERLRLLKEREELKQLRLSELRKEIAIGIEQADRGEFVDGQAVFNKIASEARGGNLAKDKAVRSHGSRRARYRRHLGLYCRRQHRSCNWLPAR